jgi:hypothetical protein
VLCHEANVVFFAEFDGDAHCEITNDGCIDICAQSKGLKISGKWI